VIPAVTHVDGTGRLQTVSKDSNPRFYAIIDRFREATGVPVLLNTSCNVANEPIVETPEDAIRCFLSTGIDAQLLGDYLLIKNGAGSTG
jgi:carbamoyltransferase